MTAVATTTAGGAAAGGGGRARVAIGIVVAVVVVLVVLALVAPARRNDGPPLDTSSTAAQGTKAAVELAGRLGADVDVTSELPGAATDVALMFEDLISPEQAPAVLDWVGEGHTLVVADPYSELAPLAQLDLGDLVSGSQAIARGACDVEDPVGLAELGALASYGPVARFEVPDGATACFADDGGAVVVVEPVGAGRVVSVGTPWVFTNEALDRADNAGLLAALAVPEAGTRLAVLVAGPAGSGLQAPDDGDLSLPTGVALALVQLLVAFVVYSLYRARRLGRPVPEDPPVVIAGSELTRAVGGLLEHAGARDRAGSSLRRAARRRLASAFGLPIGADPGAVVATVAARTPLGPDRLEAVLLDAPVVDDAALAALARDLDDVVALALGSAGPRPSPDPAAPSAPSPAEQPGGPS